MPTTQDVLFIVLAFCALWFTLFLCWLMYNVAVLAKRMQGLADEMHQKIGSIEESIVSIKRKFDGNIAMVQAVIDGLKHVIAAVRPRNKNTPKDSDTGTNDDISL